MIDEQTVRAMIGKLGIAADRQRLLNNVPLAQQGVDSLDLINLLFHFELEYDIKLPDPETDGVETIDDIVNLLNRKIDG